MSGYIVPVKYIINIPSFNTKIQLQISIYNTFRKKQDMILYLIESLHFIIYSNL